MLRNFCQKEVVHGMALTHWVEFIAGIFAKTRLETYTQKKTSQKNPKTPKNKTPDPESQDS